MHYFSVYRGESKDWNVPELRCCYIVHLLYKDIVMLYNSFSSRFLALKQWPIWLSETEATAIWLSEFEAIALAAILKMMSGLKVIK